MKVVKQDKKSITVELSPMELEVLRQGSIKESRHRNRTWTKVTPQYPEELLYHAIMKDTSTGLKAKLSQATKKYRDWGILK